MSKPLVTIAIPTYNRADKYLIETLECALNQTYTNTEILVSDNCSTDNTEEVVHSFDDPRLVYYKQEENLGSYGNMNFLLEKAKGDYFHMYHDDDRIDADFIESCMEAADYSADKSLIVAGTRAIDAKGKVLKEKENAANGASFDDFVLVWYKDEINIYLCSSLFGTEYLRKAGGFEKKYMHFIDVAAQFNCAAFGKRVDLEDVKASFRKHDGSLTSATEVDEWLISGTNLLELACSLANQKEDEIRKIGTFRSARNGYMYANRNISRKKRVKEFWKVYKYFKFKHLPPLKHCNDVVPLSGFVLHPYMTMSYMKNTVTKKLGLQKNKT